MAAALAVALMVAAPLAAQALPDEPAPFSEIELIPESAWIRPGEPFTVGVRLSVEPGWHTYWVNGGDAGLPLHVAWAPPPGFDVGPLEWPVPGLIPTPPLMSYGYEGEVLLLAEVRPPRDLAPGSSVELRGLADWLVCADVCLPAWSDIELELAVRAEPPPPAAGHAPVFAGARARMPAPANGWRLRAWPTDDGFVFEATPPPGTALPAPYLFSDSVGVVEPSAPQRVARAGEGVRLALARAAYGVDDVVRIGGVLVADVASPGAAAWSVETAVAAPPADVLAEAVDPLAAADAIETGGIAAMDGAPAWAGAGAGGLVLALLLAFFGGVLLNLMPCVFPVLAVKALAFVHGAGTDAGRARRHGLAFTAGVLVSVWALAGVLLALRAGGAGLGWGFHLQSPATVALLALLIFAMGLSLSGTFDIGLRLTRLGASGAGQSYRDSFLTGGLAVAVATPCTAPFMGVALGYALVQPASTGLAVFSALGAGLAVPYVILTSAPALIERLPRPGAWTETFKQALAFPMYATAVWLVWVLGRQAGVDAAAALLLSLVALAFGAWLWQHATASGRRTARAAAVFVLVAAAGAALYGPRAVRGDADALARTGAWEAYSAERLIALRGEGRPVFVDFTAAWCISCQVNERVALSSRPVRRAFADADVALIKADWTSRDAEIAAALESFGRSSVPLYVLYPADPVAPPEVLPVVLTPRTVVDAVARAAR